MVKGSERTALFVVFLALAVAGAVLEAFVIVALVAQPDLPRGAIAVVGGSALVGVLVVLRDLIRKVFITGERVPISVLVSLNEERSRIASEPADVADWRQRVEQVTATLQFAERCLRPWVKGSHFELCVFVDVAEPLMFAYFDSTPNRRSRSMAQRQVDPHYYVSEGYEVCEVLRARSTYPTVISDTSDPKTTYKFATDAQRRQVRSTVLMNVDTEIGCALVVSSDESGAFSPADTEVMEFLRLIASAVRFDMIRDGFGRRVRELQPGSFSSAT